MTAAKTDFLFELGTEELPPTELPVLSAALESSLLKALEDAGLNFAGAESFATPRRLALLVHELDTRRPGRPIERRGPSVAAAYDSQGNPSRALTGFARKCGVAPEQLERIATPRGEWLVFRSAEPERATTEVLPDMVATALGGLPVTRPMRWGNSPWEFARPVHWVVMLLGDQVVEANILGLPAGRTTRGLRALGDTAIRLGTPGDYANTLEEKGRVIPGFAARRQRIQELAQAAVGKLGGSAGSHLELDQALLDEVTALVEWPLALAGDFDARYLALPREVLTCVLQRQQKYFPVTGDGDNLLPHFIFIANGESTEPGQVIAGNERVIRPRLADAEFFFATDTRRGLEAMALELSSVQFQEGLGSLDDKAKRITVLGWAIQGLERADPLGVAMGQLCKADLASAMVQEFPELQGIAGYHYALAAGRDETLARTLSEHYLPRFAEDRIPDTRLGQAMAMADRLDTLAGLFALDRAPTGDRDPFGLRRAALGFMRIAIEGHWQTLDLVHFTRLALGVIFAATPMAERPKVAPIEVAIRAEGLIDFMFERLRIRYREQGLAAELFTAVHASGVTRPWHFDQRLRALQRFLAGPEAARLVGANKRVANILPAEKEPAGQFAAFDFATLPELLPPTDGDGRRPFDWDLSELNSFLEIAPPTTDPLRDFHPDRLIEDAEIELWKHFQKLSEKATSAFDEANYSAGLEALSALGNPLDIFFDQVMVMTEDQSLCNNRLALLERVRRLFLQVADFSLMP